MHSILRLGCIPAGMELFAAADEDPWSLIESIINECDYYILIMANRYGSIWNGEISYTEKEFLYAVEKKIPILPFLIAEDEGAKEENESENSKKNLKRFRENVKQYRNCSFWKDPAELAIEVTYALIDEIKKR